MVAPLPDVSTDFSVDGTPMAGDAWVGPESVEEVAASITTVPIALADIVSGGHTIVVHESAGEIGTYIACGDVGGMMLGATDLPIGLGELSDSGYNGIAWLHDNGNSTTTVNLFLTKSYHDDAEDMNDEDDSAHDDSEDRDHEDDGSDEDHSAGIEGTQVDVALSEFVITTSMPALKVGETYTFVTANTGKFTHEMVIEKAGVNDVPLEIGGVEQEIEDIHPGTSSNLTITFDTPGTYQLACHVPGHYEGGMVIEFEVTV